MIDIWQIKPGDRGTIEVTFGEAYGTSTIGVTFHKSDETQVSSFVSPSIIASHTPAPWVPENGDVVRWLSEREWTIVAIDRDEVWISTPGCDGRIAKLSYLTLIRKGAA